MRNQIIIATKPKIMISKVSNPKLLIFPNLLLLFGVGFGLGLGVGLVPPSEGFTLGLAPGLTPPSAPVPPCPLTF